MLDRTVQHKRASYTAGSSGAQGATYATQTADVPASIWPMGANPLIADAFKRMDIVTTHAICTDRDISAKAEDIITEGSDTYLVSGSMKFANSFVANCVVYVLAADLRIP